MYLKSICLEINELDPAHSRTAPGLAWQAALIQSNIDLSGAAQG